MVSAYLQSAPSPKDWGYALAVALIVIAALAATVRYLFRAHQNMQDQSIKLLEKHLEWERQSRKEDIGAITTHLERLSIAHKEETRLFLEHLERRR